MQVGVLLSSLGLADPLEALKQAGEMGMGVVQIGSMAPSCYRSDFAALFGAALATHAIRASAICAAYEAESYADMAAVARTVGLTNPHTLPQRIAHTKRCVDFGSQVGAPILTTHVGVMPQDPGCPAYRRLLDTVRRVADYCAAAGMSFALETGQETAEALSEFISAVGRGNVGVNFDPANMVLYGTGRPIQAVAALAPHVMHVHVKDGLYPEQEGDLGTEVPLGEGEVDIEQYIVALRAIGYHGPLIIEREAGCDRVGDIGRGKALVERFL